MILSEEKWPEANKFSDRMTLDDIIAHAVIDGIYIYSQARKAVDRVHFSGGFSGLVSCENCRIGSL